jgi:IrrE N-terminal-like domain
MNHRANMAAQAYRAALQLRAKTGRATNVPLCPFDVADEIGLEVRFADIASLEAMYVDDGSPKILITADRPLGRQRFSCAHELGHHVFGHGMHVSCIDFSLTDRRGLSDEEFIAQAFAGYLLMPKAAVSHAFAVRNWSPQEAVAEQFYAIAGLLGVSFEGLVTHCDLGLRLLGKKEARTLHAVKLPQLRTRMTGQSITGNLAILDSVGPEGAIDLSVGDHLLAPAGTTAANGALGVKTCTSNGTLLCALRPGLSGVQVGPQSMIAAVRIARAGYVGRAIFRHLEDPDYV